MFRPVMLLLLAVASPGLSQGALDRTDVIPLATAAEEGGGQHMRGDSECVPIASLGWAAR